MERDIARWFLRGFTDSTNWIFLNSNGIGKNYFAVQKDPSHLPLQKISAEFSMNSIHQGVWNFGFLSYDLKNQFENLHSRHQSNMGFADSYFWSPDLLMEFDKDKIDILVGSDDQIPITSLTGHHENETPTASVFLTARTSKEEYLQNFERIKWHIQRGDIYEVNYCLEWYSANAVIDPVKTYYSLNSKTHAPFSCLMKSNDQYLICASPERFLKKKDDLLVSQPIKGTAKRSIDWELDNHLKEALLSDIKEQAENVMTTDVVRNDLSRTAKKNAVKVAHLNEVQSFKTVHHLVTTVHSRVRKGVSLADIISTTFPMASMTGAPKISAMKIIDQAEDFNRGIYSGAVGYITPNGDFDFNVVIRSIIYNQQTGYISVPVGSAITSKSDPEREYEECLLKVEAMKEALLT